MTAPTCSAPGCTSAVYARGWCSRHYRQVLRRGALLPERAPAACAVDGCDRPAVTRGWCHGHYLRWSRTGDVRPDVPLRRPDRDPCRYRNGDRLDNRLDNRLENLELWTTSEPKGQRVSDQLAWARALLARYADVEPEVLGEPS